MLTAILQTIRNCLKWLVNKFNTATGHNHDGQNSARVYYDDLRDKPTLKTNNATAQATQANELLTGTIDLHKIAKTGDYNDLLNKPVAGGGSVYIPHISLAILKKESESTNNQFLRPKNGIIVSMNFSQNADFLNYNPRIVLLRQSGSRTQFVNGSIRNRQATKRFAYTKDGSGNNISFPLQSPCAQRFGNRFSFCLSEYNGQVFTGYYTANEYCAHYAYVVDILPGIKQVRLTRGGIGSRRFSYSVGEFPYPGSYASVVIGFQLVTDAGCSNIVYVKVKAIYTQLKQLIYTWSLLPNK